MRIIMLFVIFASFAFADTALDIRDLQLEKEKLESEIQKLNRQISATDSMLRSDDSRYKTLQKRYREDSERRRAEIDSLSTKIATVASQLGEERNKQSRAKIRMDNVKSKRKALNAILVSYCKKLQQQVENTVPWERESRLDRVKSLARDLESGNASEEEGFSRLKSLINEEIKFGDEITMINTPLTRKNGEIINAQVLRIGNQWMVYSDENGAVYGILIRKVSTGAAGSVITYEWKEDLNLAEREAVKLAIDVKTAKKPPQIVKLPVSLSMQEEGK